LPRRERTRRAAPLVLLLLALAACHRFDPGKPHVVLVYRTKADAVTPAMVVLRRRLDAMQVPSLVEGQGETITVKVDGRVDLPHLQHVLGLRALLELVLVDESPEVIGALVAEPLPAGVREERADLGGNTVIELVADTPEPLRVLAARLPPRWRWGVQSTGSEDHPRYWGMALAIAAVLTNRDIADARVEVDELGLPAVAATLTKDGARALEQASADSVGRRLAIVLDGAVKSAPVIRNRIGGGRLRISVGMGDPRRLSVEAEQLASILRVGALPAPLELVEVIRRGGG
jgi:preprotein translocase subunit SecD